MASDPDGFPWQFAGMTVRFGKTMWNVDPLGYQPDHPLFEVLCEIGAICDPSGWWSHTTQDAQADFYVVTFLSEKRTSAVYQPEPPFVFTEVPSDYHYPAERDPPSLGT